MSISSIASEGIEVDDHGVDRPDPVPGHDLDVVGTVAAIEEAGKDIRVERLHPAVEDLREAGDRGDVGDLHPVRFQGPGRTAGADDLDSRGLQRGGELVEARLVVDTHENPAERDRVGDGDGGNRCVVGCAHGAD